MKNYFQNLSKKINIIFVSITAIMLFVSVVILFEVDFFNIYLLDMSPNQTKMIQYILFAIVLTITITDLIYILVTLKIKRIVFGDILNMINLPFLLLFAVYLYLIDCGIGLYIVIGLFAVFLILFNLRAIRFDSSEEKIIENELVDGKGNIINYTKLLYKDSNMPLSIFTATAAIFSIFAIDIFNIPSQIFANYRVISLIIAGVLAIVYVLLFIFNYKKRTICAFDLLNNSLFVSIIVSFIINNVIFGHFSTNMTLRIILWSTALIIVLLMMILRCVQVAKRRIVLNDQLIYEKRGIAVYFKQLFQHKMTIIATLLASLAFIFTVMLTEVCNSLKVPFLLMLLEEPLDLNVTVSTLLIICSIYKSGLLLTIKDFSSKKITSADIVLFGYQMFHLLMLYPVLTHFKVLYIIIWGTLELLLLIFTIKRISSVKIEKIVDASEIIKSTTEFEEIISEDTPEEQPTEIEEVVQNEIIELVETVNEEVINDTSEDEEQNSNEPLEEKAPKEEEIIIEILPDEQLTIDIYQEYIDSYQKLNAKSSIILPEMNTKNEKVLFSVFANFTSLQELADFWSSYKAQAKINQTLRLNPYHAFALAFIKKTSKKTYEVLKDGRTYLLINNVDFYNELKSHNRNKYSAFRKQYFSKVFNTNDPKLSSVIINLFSEAKNFVNSKINKRFVKIESGSIESQESFDIYFLDVDYDLAKSRRQITKFVDLYNACKTNIDSTKQYKIFLDNLATNQYNRTMLCFFNAEIKHFKDLKKLYLEVLKKIPAYLGPSYVSLYGNVKFSAMIRDIILYEKRNTRAYIALLFEKTSNLLILDTITRLFMEQLGPKHKYSVLIEECMSELVKNYLTQKNNIFKEKAYQPNMLSILERYSSNEDFHQYIDEILNSETLYQFIGSYVNVSFDNTTKLYTYDLNKKIYSFVRRGILLKMHKEKDKSNKTEAVQLLLKENVLQTKLRINFKN